MDSKVFKQWLARLETRDPAVFAGYFLGALEIDWKRASRLADTSAAGAVSAHASRLAVGETPPAGHVRMTLSEYLEG
ncbi:hypothetical protein NKH85_07310 [Mesorhizobium sp. M0924]|uniref:hypothetical protein n=1 Tax=unclassified Mesorhizobium TaxID=325217 RepID=UPI003334B06F